MRRRLMLAGIALAAAVVPAGRGLAAARGDVPSFNGPNDACQPDPTNPQPQVLHCRYGPLTVTPGTNLILVGPVTIESPRADGYITGFSPNLVDAQTGAVPPIHVVHLHHAVWLNPSDGTYTPFAATGEEKTTVSIPPGYGYRTRPTDQWLLNYMLHNLTPSTFEVFITYDLDWVPLATGQSTGIKEVRPVWLDTVAGGQTGNFSKSLYPIYTPARDGSGFKQVFTASTDEELVWTGGHLHPGGLRDALRAETCNHAPAARLLFDSEAVPNSADARTLGSWEFRMTVSPPNWRFALRQGDQISVTAYYGTSNPWFEAMGIMMAWAHPLAAGEAPSVPFCQLPATTTGAVSPAPTPPNPPPVFGGDPCSSATPCTPDPTTQQPTYGPDGKPVTSIGIGGFSYTPGSAAPAAVTPGSSVTFTNLDAAASIYHTVTTCDLPCNADYGQSYPLASWTAPGFPNGFDSGQLGYGPPYATAAVQDASWTFSVPAGASTGQVFTFFCRIHPFMRGALEVVGS